MRQRSFFIELILVIFFFFVSAAITLQLFACAQQMSRQSAAKTGAIFAAESALERVCASERGDFSLFTGTPDAAGRLVLGYDADWRPVSEKPAYQLVLTRSESIRPGGIMVWITASVLSDETEIFSLTGQKYCSDEQ